MINIIDSWIISIDITATINILMLFNERHINKARGLSRSQSIDFLFIGPIKMARVAQFDCQMLKDGFTPTEAMVYGYLWRTSRRNRRNGLGESISPSIGLMKKTLCISRMSIIRAIDKLEKAELILVARGYKTNNEYMITDSDKYIPHCMPTPDNIS